MRLHMPLLAMLAGLSVPLAWAGPTEKVQAAASSASAAATKAEAVVTRGARKAGDAVAKGAQAAGSAVSKGAKKIGLPTGPVTEPARGPTATGQQ